MGAYNLFASPNIVRVIKLKMRRAGHVTRMGERRGVYRVLMEKTEEKRQFGRSRRRWEDNIKMDLQEVRCWGMDWIEMMTIYLLTAIGLSPGGRSTVHIYTQTIQNEKYIEQHNNFGRVRAVPRLR